MQQKRLRQVSCGYVMKMQTEQRKLKPRHQGREGVCKGGRGNESDAQGKRKLISPQTLDQQVWEMGKRMGNENREIK